MRAPLPIEEQPRLAALYDYEILDTPPEPCFDRVTRLAAQIFSTPVSAVSLVDPDRQWFKSSFGLPVCETPRDQAFCGYTILTDAPLVVLDPMGDARFADNPLVLGEPGIRFYAGAPLITPGGYRLGALCVIDLQGRSFVTDDQMRALTDLAAVVVSELEQRRLRVEQQQTISNLRKYEAALQHASDSVMMLSRTNAFSPSTLEYVNHAFTETFGYTPEEVIGKTSEILLGPETDTSVVATILKCVAARCSTRQELLMYRKNGTPFWSELQITVPEEKGLPGKFFVAIHRDITARKQVERTLIEAKEAAEAGLRSKSEFLLTMSHEIRTPLNGILAMAELLNGTSLDPEQREYVEMLRFSAQSLLRISGDILQFSKFEAGCMRLACVEFAPREWLASVTKDFRDRAQAKGVILQVETSTLPMLLRGDELRLRQIAVNLLENALKFTAAGQITVRLRQIGIHGRRVRLAFEVADTGIGIPAAVIPKLFSPFTQADSSTTRRFDGTGLGLANCRRLAELMNGSVSVESEEGRGSHFRAEVELERVSAASIMPSLPESKTRKELVQTVS